MVSNIEAVLQRGEKIELLVDKTESLNQQVLQLLIVLVFVLVLVLVLVLVIVIVIVLVIVLRP